MDTPIEQPPQRETKQAAPKAPPPELRGQVPWPPQETTATEADAPEDGHYDPAPAREQTEEAHPQEGGEKMEGTDEPAENLMTNMQAQTAAAFEQSVNDRADEVRAGKRRQDVETFDPRSNAPLDEPTTNWLKNVMTDMLQVFGHHIDKRISKVEKTLEKYEERQRAIYAETGAKFQERTKNLDAMREYVDKCERERRQSYERIVKNATENERTVHNVARSVKNTDSRIKELEAKIEELTEQMKTATLSAAAAPQQQQQQPQHDTAAPQSSSWQAPPTQQHSAYWWGAAAQQQYQPHPQYQQQPPQHTAPPTMK